MRTYFPKAGDIKPRWFVIDAEGQVIGRLSTQIASIISGKSKPTYTPFLDTGDHVIVVNAAQVHLTGRKEDDKVYRRHSGFMGGLKETAAGKMRQKHPTRIIEEAIKGMLPKTKLGRAMFGKLKVYSGPDHPHQAQKPVALAVGSPRRAEKKK